LSITVDGPSKVDLSCNEVDDGYEVTYTPMAPGKYYVTVKYNGKNVRGSPFSVMINGDNLTSSTTINTNNNNRAINTNRYEFNFVLKRNYNGYGSWRTFEFEIFREKTSSRHGKWCAFEFDFFVKTPRHR
jgi:hypothetical protein